MTKRPSSKAGRDVRSGTGPKTSTGGASDPARTENAAPASVDGTDGGAAPAATGTTIVTDVARSPAPSTAGVYDATPTSASASPADRRPADVSSGEPRPAIASDAAPSSSTSSSAVSSSAVPSATGIPRTGSSTDELAAAAAVEGARSEPRRGSDPHAERSSGMSPLAAAAIAAVLVAGLLAAYDAFVRGGQDDAAVARLEERLAAVEATATQAQTTASAAEETAAGAAAEFQASEEERAAALEGRIEERLAEIAATAQAASEAAASAPGEERLAALEQRLAELVERIDTQIAPVVTGFEAATADATGAAEEARAALEEARSGLVAEMQALREAVAGEAQETRRAYLAITAANAIVSALPAGTPYAGSLATLAEAGVSQETYAALEPFAETGAPTAETLRAAYVEVSPEIRRALTPEDAGDGVGSFFEGLFARAVRVEPVEGLEQPPGEPVIDPTADVARALTIGDLPAAFSSWQALPERARAVSQDFGDLLAARIAAGDAARDAVDEARAALSPQAQ